MGEVTQAVERCYLCGGEKMSVERGDAVPGTIVPTDGTTSVVFQNNGLVSSRPVTRLTGLLDPQHY